MQATIQRLFLMGLVVQGAACATTGATFRSGVGDTRLDHPPYYAGAAMTDARLDASRIGHVPVVFQRGATQPPTFDPRSENGTPLDSLVRDMNAYLDALDLSTRLVALPPPNTGRLVPPDVRFGCPPENGLPGEECAPRSGGALGRGRQEMQLSVGRPSQEWTQWMADAADDASADLVLVVTLEIGEYFVRQEGILGKKVLELGTGHRASLPWLMSLETPVSVLQLTGALVDRTGRAVRIGAEGFHARRTLLAISVLGAQEVLTDADVAAARTNRRDDLPGAPLAWQVALHELVEGVTGRVAR